MQTTDSSSTLPASKRITIIDATRGIALIGICLAHALQHFGGPFSNGVEPSFAWAGTMDETVSWILRYLVMGKFFIIFSFLFGLSFFIQMDGAARKGVDFRGRFLWRLTLLFIIGLLHSAIFRLDILIIYALLGVPLVFMYKLPNKALAGIALFFLMGGAQLAVTGYKAIVPSENRPVTESLAEKRQRYQGIAREASLPVVLGANVTEQLGNKLDFQFGEHGRGYITMAFFILGLLAGRVRLFQDLPHYEPTLYKAAWAALAGVALLYALQPHIPQAGPGTLLAWTSMLVANIINLLSAYLWMTLIIWLYKREPVRRGLVRVVSYGRMGLTNYIAQSVIGVCLFYGFGLGLHGLGVFFSVLICLAYTLVQIQVSHLWLKKFRYGSLEWLWRSGTYLRWQPLRVAPILLLMLAMTSGLAARPGVPGPEQDLVRISNGKWGWTLASLSFTRLIHG